MHTASDAIAKSIGHAARVILMFTEDVKGADWNHRACAGANCAAWILGHLVLSARRMMQYAGHADLPALPEGFEQRFARDDAAPKSSDYGDCSQLRDLFKQHHDLFVAVARRQTPETLAKDLGMNHPVFDTVGGMLSFAPVHIATHAGQISTIRRSLGRAALV
jgi:hypothetical protein